MLPLLRLLAIGIKMCTEPIIGQVKNFAQIKAAGRFRSFLIFSGGRIHYYESRINKKFLSIKEENDIEGIPDEDAIEKSLSFILEVFFLYGILFYWAINETLDSIESSKQLKKDLDNLKESNQKLQKDYETMKTELNEIKQSMVSLKKTS